MLEQLLQDAYGVTGLPVTPIPSGAVNQNWVVGGRYVLKRYEAGKYYQPDEILRTLAAQALAGRAGVPVPEVVPNLGGAALTVADDGFYTLSAYVKGRQYKRGEIPAAAARSMGRALGQIHSAFHPIEPLEPYAVADPERQAARMERLLRLAGQRGGSDPVDERACRILRHKLTQLEELGHLVPWFARLPVQWVHGDYQDTNVLFTEGEAVAAVIDFDNFRCRSRAHEVMRSLDYSFRAGSEESYAFFAGYCETAPDLRADEVALYAPLWAYTSAAGLWPLEVRYEAPERYQSRWDRFITAPSDWWSRNMEAVTERLVAIAAGVTGSGSLHNIG